MSWQTLREIVEALDVAEYVDLLSERPRFEEAWEALKWVLARNPEPKGSALKLGPEGVLYRSYVLASDSLANTPDIWVVYTYTATQVIIFGVQAKTPSPDVDVEEG